MHDRFRACVAARGCHTGIDLTSFVDHLCDFCLVLLCFHARLFVDALWSPAGKGLTSWLSFVLYNCDVVTFPIGTLGQVWHLIVFTRK